MQSFSELLRTHIHDKGIDVQKLSAYLNISPSLLYKVMKGTRTLTEQNQLKKICEYLNLTVGEQEALAKAHVISVIGEDRFSARLNIEKFLRNLSGFNPSNSTIPPLEEFADIPKLNFSELSKTYESEHAVQLIVNLLLRYESYQENSHLRMVFDLDDDYLASLLSTLDNNSIEIEHIMSLHTNNYGQNGDIASYLNLNVLSSILSATSFNSNYHPYYYFRNVESQVPFLSMNSMILLPEAVLLIATDKSSAILLTDSSLINYYMKIFGRLKSSCSPFINKVINLDMMADYLSSMTKNKAFCSRYELQIDPCIFIHMPQDIFLKYVNRALMENNTIKQVYGEYRKQLYKNYQSGTSRSYHTVDGFKRFLDTGITQELPDQAFSPVDLQDRITCIKNLLKAIERKEYNALLLKNWPYSTSGFIVSITNQAISFQVKNRTGYTVYLLLDIPRFLISFNDFFENVIDHMCHTHEETIAIIKHLLEEAEERLQSKEERGPAKEGRLPDKAN